MGLRRCCGLLAWIAVTGVVIGSLTAGAVPQGGRYASATPNQTRPGIEPAGRRPAGPHLGGGGPDMVGRSARGAWLAGALAVLVAVGGTAAFVARRRRPPRT
ncbi:hypothetical protein [Nonomuraea sp. bgisy101]|uniref:hypothetical protein n=1 Tax=Nonomuraea sp. bgisy101 TaxID=3413784 RepID=UPI003D74092C